MTPRFLFRRAARAELLEARARYEWQRQGLGVEFATRIDATMSRISEHPILYPEVRPGIRRAVLLDFPYSIFYRVKSEVIEVLAVFHHRRNPRVWQSRTAV